MKVKIEGTKDDDRRMIYGALSCYGTRNYKYFYGWYYTKKIEWMIQKKEVKLWSCDQKN